ncbi:AI-2E family transporter [Frigoribacterium sp. MCBA15_019]|uniref:AI-2E family transporter n=1 Tax=unclassified Frigoribacterium TaxID=2627005 RepID=UPI0009F62CD8|nr:AI-2E family transporter [Frigoribacterium sp. MCBA15_019]
MPSSPRARLVRRSAATATKSDTPPSPMQRPGAFRFGLIATLGGGLGVGIIVALMALSTIIVYIGLAFFLALAFEPVVRRLARAGAPRWVGVIVAVVLVVGIVVGIVAAVVPALIEQIGHVVQTAPGALQDLSRQPWVQQAVETVGFDVDVDDAVGAVTSYLLDPDQLLALGGGLLAVGQGITNAVTAVIVVAILTLYFAITLPQMLRSLSRAVPRSHRENVMSISDEIFLSVGRYVAGQVALAAVNAVFVFVVLTIAGGPVPVLFATLAFLGALIPVVGTVVAYAIIIAATITVSPVTAVVVGIVLLVYAQVEAYVLTPRVMSKAVAVPGALVIVAAFGGGALGGVLGALVAIPIATAGVVVFERVVVPRQQRV